MTKENKEFYVGGDASGYVPVSRGGPASTGPDVVEGSGSSAPVIVLLGGMLVAGAVAILFARASVGKTDTPETATYETQGCNPLEIKTVKENGKEKTTIPTACLPK